MAAMRWQHGVEAHVETSLVAKIGVIFTPSELSMDEADASNLSLATNAGSESDSSHAVCQLLPAPKDEEDDDDIGEYYFESDHLALKNNSDYRRLLKALAVLQAQRTKALQDIDKLLEAKDTALEDPITFVEKLRRGEDLNLPKPQKIYQLPVIDWDKYSRSINTSSFTTHKHMTRHNKPTAAVTSPSPPPPANDNNPGLTSTGIRLNLDEPTSALARGRSSSMGKSETYNVPWTEEEQLRLDDLLKIYPEEAVEARRWEKIASALGNRTHQQVASRVQKYFNKLAKFGQQVPGRMPRMTHTSRKTGAHRHPRHNRLLFQRSTFLASYTPSVFISDYDDDIIYSAADSVDENLIRNVYEEQGDELISPHLHDTQEYKELMYLKQLKKVKEQQNCQNTAPLEGDSASYRIQCSRCSCELKTGRPRYCVDCPPGALYLCDNCSNSNFEGGHLPSHRLEALWKTPYSFGDGDYNYLDPNFMPVTNNQISEN